MQKSAKIALIACVGVVLVGGFAFWFFVLRSDAPPRASLPDRPVSTAPGGTGTDGTDGTAGGSTDSAEGDWTVEQADDVFVGYRVQELFGGETIKVDAVGRTPGVEGTLTIEGTQVTAVSITADMTGLTSDRSQRDNFIRGRSLETEQFPTATFTLTEPIDIGTPSAGETLTVQATGDLTLHGVTRTVTIPLEAQWNGTTISVSGGLEIVMADYDITPPDVSVVTVDDRGELELQLVFVRA